MNTVLPIVAALAALASSFIMDRALRMIHIRAAQTSTLATWYLGGLAIALLFVALLLTSAWAIALRNRTPRWVGLLIAVLALFLVLGLPVAASGLSPMENLLQRPLLRSELLLLEAAPDSLLMLQTIALLISGLCALVRPQPR
jgi:hypothetical protein